MLRTGFDRGRVPIGGVLVVLICLLAWPVTAGAVTQVFYEKQAFTVPAEVTSLHVIAVGEEGEDLTLGGGNRESLRGKGGRGARLSGELAVFPGQTLYINPGESDGGEGGQSAGWGGGSTSIATGPTPSAKDLLVVAAGGGGGGGSRKFHGGPLGGNAGEAGQDGEVNPGNGAFGEGGGAGTLSAGGIGGLFCKSTSHRAESGGFDRGGNGAQLGLKPGDFEDASSGGGGGGYHGGGAGGLGCYDNQTGFDYGGGGGGGGASLAPPGWTEGLAARELGPRVEVSYAPLTPPTVTGVSPGEGKGGGGTVVEITGTHLDSVEEVRFGSTAVQDFTINSDSSITVTAPAGNGSVDVTVAGLEGSSPAGPGDQFTYEPVPTVTALSPSSGPAAGGTT